MSKLIYRKKETFEIVLKDNGGSEKVISLCIKSYAKYNSFKSTVPEDKCIFILLNKYLESLTNKQRSSIFEEYKKIAKSINNVVSLNSYNNKISQISNQLYSIIDLEHLNSWISENCAFNNEDGYLMKLDPLVNNEYSSNIRMSESEDMKVELPDGYSRASGDDNKIAKINGSNTKEQTYITQDFIDLISLSIITRMMIPMWAVYLKNLNAEAGVAFQEINLLHTLTNKNIDRDGLGTSLSNHPGFKKLENYIGMTYAKNNNTDNKKNSTLLALGDEDLFKKTLGTIICRKIPVIDFIKDDVSMSIKFIYKSIMHVMTNMSKPQENVVIKALPSSAENNNDENAGSSIDYVRAKDDITEGHKVEINMIVESVTNLIKIFYPKLTKLKERKEKEKEYLDYCDKNIENTDVINKLDNIRRNVIKVLINDIFKAELMDYLEYDNMVKLFLMVNFKLLELGHEDIFKLLNSSRIDVGDDEIVVAGGFNIDKEQEELVLLELDKIFPFKITQGSLGLKYERIVVKAVETLLDAMYDYKWFYNEEELSFRGRQLLFYKALLDFRIGN